MARHRDWPGGIFHTWWPPQEKAACSVPPQQHFWGKEAPELCPKALNCLLARSFVRAERERERERERREELTGQGRDREKGGGGGGGVGDRRAECPEDKSQV